MEYPWGKVSADDDTCPGDIACDIAKLRITAAAALKNIETVYRDIMKCDGGYRKSDVILPNFANYESEVNDDCSSKNSSKSHRNSNHERCSKNSISESSKTFHIEACRQSFNNTPDSRNSNNGFCSKSYNDRYSEYTDCKHFLKSVDVTYCHNCGNQCSSYNSSECSSRSSNIGSDGEYILHNQLPRHRVNLLCYRCKNYFMPPERVIKPSKYIQYEEVQLNPIQCNDCTCKKLNHIFNDFTSAVGEGHSLKQSQNISNANAKSTSKRHKCLLKVTVPEPFQMTLRDECRKPLKELKLEQLRKQLNDEKEKEMQVSIYSSPVPAHVNMPIYKQMVKNSETRKQLRKTVAESVKKALVKPFNLTFEKNGLRRADSVPNFNLCHDKYARVPKANPIPKHVLDSSVSDKIKTKEIARKTRIRQRAEETLQKSNLPFSSRKSFQKTSSMVNLTVDTGGLQSSSKDNRVKLNNYSEEIMKNWNSRVASVVSPESSQELLSTKSYQDRYKDFLSLQNCPLADVPIRMTAASMLREKEIRRDLSEKQERSNITSENKKMKAQLLSQLKLNDLATSSQEELEKKLQNFRMLRRARQQEYEKELLEMNIRVENQPLLIIRQTQNKRQLEVSPQKKKASSKPPSTEESSPKPSSCSDEESENDSFEEAHSTEQSD